MQDLLMNNSNPLTKNYLLTSIMMRLLLKISLIGKLIMFQVMKDRVIVINVKVLSVQKKELKFKK